MARHRHHWITSIVVVVSAAASIATSKVAPKEPRAFPAWFFTSGERHTQQCVDVYGWVSKSGKTGFGMSLELRSKGDCLVEFTSATLVLGEHTVKAADLWDPLDMKGHSLLFAYIPFEFDNNEAWNDGLRDGTVEVTMTTNGNAGPVWTLGASHRRNATHRDKTAPPWDETQPRTIAQ